MQLRKIIAMGLLAGALPAAAACGPHVTIADENAGDDDDGGTTTSSTGGTSTTSTTGSTSTDTWTPTPTGPPSVCEQESPDCKECEDCALDGPCGAEMDTCVANTDCLLIIYCANDCDVSCGDGPDPQACRAACVYGPGGCMETYPLGTGDYSVMTVCVYQVECGKLCGGT